MGKWIAVSVLVLLCATFTWSEATRAQVNPAVDRGRDAIRNVVSHITQTTAAYDNVWQQWGVAQKPENYAEAFQQRYGLHGANYQNDGFPLGLYQSPGPMGTGIASNCLICHAGSIAGQTLIGLGNASLDMQTLYEELNAADAIQYTLPLRLSNVRGTVEASAATVFLLQFRDAHLNLRASVPLDYRDVQCEDIPAWWHLKKKRTMYYSGLSDTRAFRPLMSFLMSPLHTGEYIKSQKDAFADIREFILQLEPPRYPYPIDRRLAAAGRIVFEETCTKCHGTYGPDGEYPNKFVPLHVIGTDTTVAKAYNAKTVAQFRKNWLFQEKSPEGRPYHVYQRGAYQAPPLDGIWATAPYFHNGSVPTVYQVLKSRTRPTIFTRSFQTGKQDYDQEKLGWKHTALKRAANPDLPLIERRKVYDTTQPARSNRGHRFGDKLTHQQRMAVIEYLKTL